MGAAALKELTGKLEERNHDPNRVEEDVDATEDYEGGGFEDCPCREICVF